MLHNFAYATVIKFANIKFTTKLLVERNIHKRKQ